MVTATAVPSAEAVLEVEGNQVRFADVNLTGHYEHVSDGLDSTEDSREFVVAIRWEHTVPRANGVWQPGMFANQNSACKLKSQFTIETVSKAFALDE